MITNAFTLAVDPVSRDLVAVKTGLTEEQLRKTIAIATNPFIDSEAYILRTAAGVCLNGHDFKDGYVRIEMSRDPQQAQAVVKFINYLNRHIFDIDTPRELVQKRFIVRFARVAIAGVIDEAVQIGNILRNDHYIIAWSVGTSSKYNGMMTIDAVFGEQDAMEFGCAYAQNLGWLIIPSE